MSSRLVGPAQRCVDLGIPPALSESGWTMWVLNRRELRRARSRARWHRPVASLNGPSFCRTAIGRTSAPAPLRALGSLLGSCRRGLYHGIGRDQHGLKILARQCDGVAAYDPNHPSASVRSRPKGKFDRVLSLYTLNVLGPKEGRKVLADIEGLLAPDGLAVIAVRRDVCR